MADQKLSQLTELGSAPSTSDLLYLDHSGTSNSLTIAHLFTSPVLVKPNIGVGTGNLLNLTPQALTVTSNAATADVINGIQNFTNSSAATITITLTTLGSTDGQWKEIRIYDFSAVAQSITWVNTENSTTTVPTTSNGSTTLPLSVLFQFNGITSKWRCVATS